MMNFTVFLFVNDFIKFFIKRNSRKNGSRSFFMCKRVKVDKFIKFHAILTKIHKKNCLDVKNTLS